jgi:hypothetical protein
MKMMYALCSIIALIAVSCGEEGPTDAKEKEPESPYSGYFSIADTIDFSTCALTAPLGAFINVKVEEDTIVFAGMAGAWDESEARGHGVTPERTVPINPGTGCNGYYTIEFDITYTDYDHFHGYYRVSNRYSPECGAQPCSYGYRIGGNR